VLPPTSTLLGVAAVLTGLAASAPAALGAQRVPLSSPSRTLTAQVTLEGDTPSLTVRRSGTVVLHADLGRLPAARTRAARASRATTTRSRLSGAYATTAGKRRRHSVSATQLTIRLRHGARLQVALADDGVAFKQTGFADQTVAYRPIAGQTGYLQKLRAAYEGDYVRTPIRAARGRVGYPALLADKAQRTYTLLTETGVPYGEPGEHLSASARRPGVLTTATAKDHKGASRTGWRVAVIGSLADVVASDLPEDLATASKIPDPSWIKPGRVAWSWWSDSLSPARLGQQQQYVDFAAEAGFEYVLVDYGWDPSWVPALVAYAAERGVRILLWTDWHALETAEQRARLMDQWQAWGVAGIKADFLHSDSGARMRVMDDIAADAAARRLVVNFHGCTVPRGLQRTWPNVLAVEGVWGAEHTKGDQPDDPALNVTLAFTRNVIGSMDYTPVTFSASRRVSTAAAQLAQSIVFESGLQHYADDPVHYRARPEAVELLRAVPAAWDDVRLLAGAPRESVTLARRHGHEWFIGSLSATAERTETVSLRFLAPDRIYTARLYADGPGDTIRVSEQTVTRSSTLSVAVSRFGGYSVRLTPAA
jgi:hypothetical protein